MAGSIYKHLLSSRRKIFVMAKVKTFYDSEEFRRRICLIQGSIKSLYISSSCKNPASFYHLINRALLISHASVCVSIYKYDGEVKSGNKLGYYYYCDKEFVVEQQHKRVLNERLSKIHGNNRVDGKFRLSARSRTSKNMINVYGTEYYFLLFRVTLKESPGERMKFSLIANPGEKICCINDYVFCGLKSIFGDKTISQSFRARIRKSIERFRCPALGEASGNHDFSGVEKKYFHYLEDSMEGAVSAVYRGIEESSFSILREVVEEIGYTDIPNITFYTRFYSRNKNRHVREGLESYDYDVKMVLPSPQEEKVKRHFKQLKEYFLEEGVCVNNAMEMYKVGRRGKLYSDQVVSDDRRRSFLCDLDRLFWKIFLGSDGENKIIEIIKSKTGDNFRSVTDSVFSSSIIHYRNPFDLGGIDRVIGSMSYNSVEDVGEADLVDLLRIVSVHYLYDAMAPCSNRVGNNLMKLALFPLELSGRVSFVVGHVMYVDDIDFLDQKTWDGMYYFYHCIANKVERGLRKNIRRIYIEKSFRNFQKLFLNFIKSCYDSNTIDAVQDKQIQNLVDQSNDYALSVARFAPFNLIKFHISDKCKADNFDESLAILNTIYIDISQSENPFFPSIIDSGREKAYSIDVNELYRVLNQYVKRMEDEIIWLTRAIDAG